MARTGRPIAQLAREFEASANAIRQWVKQAGLDEGLRSDGLTTAEREELNRRRIIELARAGRSIDQLAREFEPTANAIRKWVKQAGLDEGVRSDGLTTAEREELNRLRRENRVLREEREILAKAAAWCVSRPRA